MPNDKKKIEIDGPVEIVIGSKEEKKKAVTMPTECKDGEKIYYPKLVGEIDNFFIDEFNKSTQKGFLTSIRKNVEIIRLEEYVNICTNEIKGVVCNNIIPIPIHCGKPMIIAKEAGGKAKLKCGKCKISSEVEILSCTKCKENIEVSKLNLQIKENKIERIVVELNESTQNNHKRIYLCPEGSTFKDLRLSLYKTFKGKPFDYLTPKKDKNGEKIPNFLIPEAKKHIYVKFKQFNHKTGKKEVRTSLMISKIKVLKCNRSWEIPPLGLPKGTVRSFLLMMVFWLFLGVFLPEPDKIFHPIQVEVFMLLIVVFIPSLLDKLDIKDDYKTGGKLTFLGGAGIIGWITFQNFFEANTFNLMIAPLFVLVGIALRKAANEVISNHPESEGKKMATMVTSHILALVVLVYVGVYVYFNLELGTENIADIYHIFFAIFTSFYVSERLFEQDVKLKATYYPEKEVSSTV